MTGFRRASKRHFSEVPSGFLIFRRATPRVALRLTLALAVSAAVSTLLACGNDASARSEKIGETTSRPGVSSDVEPAGLRWARTVDWARRGDTVELVVKEPWKGARRPLRYLLSVPQSGDAEDAGPSSPPQDPPAPTVGDSEPSATSAIGLPARRIACLAAVHVGFLAALGETGRIVAVDAKRHVYDASVRAAVESGTVVEVGSGSTVDAERLLAARPDLVLTNAVEASENASLERLRRAGIPVIVTAEWMERHPLARAEWVRLFGVLTGAEARADSVFAAVEAAYAETARAADRDAARTGKPSVLLGGPFRDQWFVSGGRSYMARLIADAGGVYPWREDTTAGGVPLSFEAVLARARNADVWLLPGDWRSLADGVRQDGRFTGFSAFRRGAVYNNDARLRADGANDYWESGVARPDRVLADFAYIFHGGEGAGEEALFYHRRLPPLSEVKGEK